MKYKYTNKNKKIDARILDIYMMPGHLIRKRINANKLTEINKKS